MSVAAIHQWLNVLQSALGLIIVLWGLVLLACGIDARSRASHRWGTVGLVCWGAWLALQSLAGRPHDSPPSLAMAGLVAYVLVRYGRQVRGILDGEAWWPPNQISIVSVDLPPRRTGIHPCLKLCPWWALFGNADDGYFGDDNWRAGRPKSLLLALDWWLRNPAHNLTWYVIGVADRPRTVSGVYGNRFHRPGGGWLTSWTSVRAFGLSLQLPYVSYLSAHVKGYAGWRPSGAFGLKLNLSITGEPAWLTL